MLIEAAAQRWNVPATECTAASSVITHTSSGRTLRYGEVAADAAKLPVPDDVKLKTPAQWTIIGKGVKRLDTVDKLSGKQVFAIDVQLPDMLNAAIAQCPVFGGTLKSFDADNIKSMPGVRQVVAVGDNAVAVVADKWYQAKTALAALPIVWNEGAGATVDSAQIAALLKGGLDAKEAALGQKHGDVEAALAGAAKTIEAVYGAPFLAHATMEPMNCTAKFSDGKVEIWVPSQNGDASLASAAEAAGVKLADVKVNKLLLGGGFGRRGQQVNLTPFAAMLDDGQPHTVGLSVFNADNYFSATGLLRLYLDKNATQVTGAVTSNTLTAPNPVITENIKTSPKGYITGTVDDKSSHNFQITGYANTSHGKVTTTVAQDVSFNSLQYFKITNVEYEQNINQQSTLHSVVTTTNKSGTTVYTVNHDWPLLLNITIKVLADGSETQTTISNQYLEEDEAAKQNGQALNFSLVKNRVTTTDTLNFNSSGQFTGNSNQSSAQTYFGSN